MPARMPRDAVTGDDGRLCLGSVVLGAWRWGSAARFLWLTQRLLGQGLSLCLGARENGGRIV